MKVSLKVIAPKGGYEEAFAQDAGRVRAAQKATMKEAGARIKVQGRGAIAAGMSGRFASGFNVKTYSSAVFAYHKIPYAGQFEDPKPVIGRPHIWLPIAANLPGGTRWTPAKYTKQIGPLKGGRQGGKPLLFGQVSVNRKAQPVKLAKKGGFRGKAVGKAWLPVFVGVSQVNDPKRFDTGAVVKRVAGEIEAIYSEKWGSDG